MNGQAPASTSNGTDTNVVFNTAVKPNGATVTENSIITLTKDSTRPQSVWYTVSASGNTGGDSNTAITQQSYTPTPDENNNIFAINKDKIAGATNNGQGCYGYGMGTASSSNNISQNNSKIYTTIVGGSNNPIDVTSSFGNPFASPNKGSLQTNATSGNTNITLSQNYLPLGITSAVKDAYFNHNGII